jgi:CBS domain-containing protein
MESVGELMTSDPICFDAGASVIQAARAMRDASIGDVVVTTGGRVHGILTDRDIVVRCLAERGDASGTCGEACSTEVVTVAPDTSVQEAIELMREHKVRRLVVVEDDRPVGILSLGDLARERDRGSALGDISAAPPNN